MYTHKGHIFIISFFLLWSCSDKEDAIMKYNSNLSFLCGMNTIQTKGYTQFSNGNTAAIYSFTVGDISYFCGGTPMNTTASYYGLLIPDYPIYLPNGCYDFYSVSINTPSFNGLSFSNGRSGDMSNGKDYLWAANKGYNLHNGGVVNFLYNHVACQVKLRIAGNTRITNLSVNHVNYTLPATSGVKIDLSTGVVTMASSLEAPGIIQGNGNSRSFICLPCSIPMQIEFDINATIDGDSVFGKIYKGTLSQQLIGGYSYDIILNLNPDNTFATTCNIIPWQTIVDNITY